MAEGRYVVKTGLDTSGIKTGFTEIKNEAGKTATEISRSLETGVTKSNLKSSLVREAGEAGKQGGNALVSSFGSALAALGAGQVTRQYLGFLSESAQLAQNAASSNALFEKSLQRNNIALLDGNTLVKELSERFGVAESVIESSATTLLRQGASLNDISMTLTAAGASAAAAGTDISTAFENVSVAVATGRSELLESSGIIANLGPVAQDYAKSIGKTVEQLTQQELIQARVNAIYKESRSEIEDLDTVLSGLPASQAAVKQEWTEFRENVGGIAKEVIVPLNNALATGLKLINDLPQPVKTFGVAGATAATGVTALGLGVVSVTTAIGVLRPALAGLGVQWATLRATMLPFLGPAGILLGAAAGYYALNSAMDAGKSARQESEESFNTLIGKMESYRSGLQITSEAERTRAIEGLERQKEFLSKSIEIQESYISGLEESIVDFADDPWWQQLFSFGGVNVDIASLEQANKQLGELRGQVEAVDTSISTTKEIKIEVDPPAGGSEDDPFKGVSASADTTTTSIEDVNQATKDWVDRLTGEVQNGLKTTETAIGLLEPRLQTLREEAALKLTENDLAGYKLVEEKIGLLETAVGNFKTQAEQAKTALVELLNVQGAPSAVGYGAGTATPPKQLDSGNTQSSRESFLNRNNDARDIALDTANALGQTLSDAVKTSLFGSYEFSSDLARLNAKGDTALDAQNLKQTNKEVQDFSSTLAGYNAQADAANDAAAKQAEANRQVQDFSSVLLGFNATADAVLDATARNAAQSRQAIVDNYTGPSTIGNAPVAVQFGAGRNPFGANADLTDEQLISQKLQAEALAENARAIQDFSSDLYNLGRAADTVADATLRAADAEKTKQARILEQRPLTNGFNLLNSSPGALTKEDIKFLAGQGAINLGPDGVTDEAAQTFLDGVTGASATQLETADKMANTLVNAAGQVGDVLLGALSGNLSAGGIVSGLGGAAAGIVGAINPLAGTITGVATSFLGGAIDFFTGGNKDEEEKRKRESEKSRSVPAINITANVNQTNNYTGVPSDPRTVATNEQQTRFLISEVLTQLKYPQVLEKVGLS